MDPSLFKGIVLCVNREENPFVSKPLKGFCPGGEECTLLEAFERCGGIVVDFEREDTHLKATHVLAKHVEQQCYAWGRDHEKTAINFLWLWDSLRLQKLFPTEDEIYQAFPGSSIAGAEGCNVTITGYIGHQRHVLQHTIESLGLGLMLEMKPQRCTHVITADVEDRTSRKLLTARGEQFKQHIKVVNTAWLYDCARRWDILSADAYLENLPLEVDPVQGAPLMNLSDGNTVANTPEDCTGPSRDEGLGAHQSLLQGHEAGAHEVAGPHLNTISRQHQEAHKDSEQHQDNTLPMGEVVHPDLSRAFAVKEASALTRTRSPRELGLPPDSTVPATQGVLVVPSDANHQKGRVSSTTSSLLASSSAMPRDPAVRRLCGRSPCTPVLGPAVSSAAQAGSRLGVASRKSSGTAMSSAVPASSRHQAALPESSLPGGLPVPDVAGNAPGPAPIRAGGAEALQLFAPLLGSEELFGCNSLGAAQAMAARLASQLGPSLELAAEPSAVSPAPPKDSPFAQGNVARQGAQQARTPLTELLPGAFQPEGDGIPSFGFLEPREEAGGPALPQSENPMPAKKATRGRLKTEAHAVIKGPLRSRKAQRDRASDVRQTPGPKGDPTRSVKDVGQMNMEGSIPSAQPGGARRKLGPQNPLLREPTAKSSGYLQPARARAKQRDSLPEPTKAGPADQFAEGSGPSTVGQGGKQRRKRSREAHPETSKGELPAADPSGPGASSRTTKRLRKPTSLAASHDPAATSPTNDIAGMQQPAHPALLPHELERLPVEARCDAKVTPAVSYHTPQCNAVRGGNQTASSARPPASLSTGAERQRPVRALVLLSGMHTREQQQNLRALSSQGVSCIAGKCERRETIFRALFSCETRGVALSGLSRWRKFVTTLMRWSRWPSGVTHIVEPHLSRSLKSLAGMAAGAWLIATAFVGACQASCGLVEPDNYELQTGNPGVIDGKAPKHWRVRHERLGTGAFQGLQVTFFGKVGTGGGPNRSALTTIIKAGGGEVCSLQHALRHGADLAIMEADVVSTDANVARLQGLGVTCATPLYIVEWLARPWADLKGHVLFQNESAGNLALAEKQRGLTP